MMSTKTYSILTATQCTSTQTSKAREQYRERDEHSISKLITFSLTTLLASPGVFISNMPPTIFSNSRSSVACSSNSVRTFAPVLSREASRGTRRCPIPYTELQLAVFTRSCLAYSSHRRRYSYFRTSRSISRQISYGRTSNANDMLRNKNSNNNNTNFVRVFATSRCCELGMASVHQASSVDAAMQELKDRVTPSEDTQKTL